VGAQAPDRTVETAMPTIQSKRMFLPAANIFLPVVTCSTDFLRDHELRAAAQHRAAGIRAVTRRMTMSSRWAFSMSNRDTLPPARWADASHP